MRTDVVDAQTARAARVFLDRIASSYAVSEAILFGSRARRTHREDSDADIAVVIQGSHGKRSTVALDMAGVAFEVLLSTGVLIEALPLWQDEFDHPEHFNNPALIEDIRRDGVRLRE
ncbi:MAG: nucleotidyltransferase domain-containing protein [Candidatus Accumulibacter sp.]|uniref:Nucleotidyltransferase domain-containing protein n=1 Tax=Candidatus Accumulibacter affinis TaxID=2954384 RepID=A0A935T6L1_9PROT|nr:nucleotidyltransferase domain-containing protein [Candidatus Accumulibacter affinis]